MKTKGLSRIMLTLMLIGILTLAFNIQRAGGYDVWGPWKVLSSYEPHLGDVVHATVTGWFANGIDYMEFWEWLPLECSYIDGSFTVNGIAATPTIVSVYPDVIFYDITTSPYTIEFDFKVIKAYWKDVRVDNDLVGYFYDEAGNELGYSGQLLTFTIARAGMDLELYPREVVDIEEPTGTQWHELHPNNTNYYHLTGWEPGMVLGPEDNVTMDGELFLVNDLTIDIEVWNEETGVTRWLDYECGYWIFKKDAWWYSTFGMRASKWKELKNTLDGPLPTPRTWRLVDWEDNGDDRLSACDRLGMQPMFPNFGSYESFHVENVTVTLKLTHIGSYTQYYLDFVGSLEEFEVEDHIHDPWGTQWHQVLPSAEQGRIWTLDNWADGVFLSPSDRISLDFLTPEQWDEFWSMGDVNEDGYINLTDHSLLLDHFGTSDPQYDIDESGLVDFMDIGICLSNQGLDIWTYFGVPPPEWYHVDKVTVAMNLTKTSDETEHIVKFEGSLVQFKYHHWMDPVHTQWFEVSPNDTRQWHLGEWSDDNVNDRLDFPDLIWMIDKMHGDEEEFRVESLSTDIIISPVIHDIAVLGTGPARMRIPDPFFGTTMPVVAVVKNEGMETETFDVSIFYDTTLIGTSTVTLDAGATETVSFDWNLGALPNGVYTISASASVVPAEIDTVDNYSVNGEVRKTFDGEVNADGIVDASDLFDLSNAYGSTTLAEDINSDGIVDYTDFGLWYIAFGTTNPYADIDDNGLVEMNDFFMWRVAFEQTGSPNWNPYADMNADNMIDDLDLAVLNENYGSNEP